MMALFRKIRYQLLNTKASVRGANPTQRYFKYAIGEIILVVIGILIALQVNNWNENRKSFNKALELKMRLMKDISSDMESMEKRVRFFKTLLEFGMEIEDRLTQPKTWNHNEQWQFLLNAFHVSQLWDFAPISATYNEIENSNLLGYIGSSKLSNQLSQYYIQDPIQRRQIVGGTAEYRDYIRSIVPIKLQKYIWENCYNSELIGTQIILDCQRPDWDPEMLTPIYETIFTDQHFKTLLTNRLSTIYVRNELYKINLRVADSIILTIKQAN